MCPTRRKSGVSAKLRIVRRSTVRSAAARPSAVAVGSHDGWRAAHSSKLCWTTPARSASLSSKNQ